MFVYMVGRFVIGVGVGVGVGVEWDEVGVECMVDLNVYYL